MRTLTRLIAVTTATAIFATGCGGGDDDGTEHNPSELQIALADYMAADENDTPASTREEADCAAAEIVRVIGEDRLTELGVTAADIPELEDVGFEDSEVGIVLGAFDQCMDLDGAFRDALAEDVGDEAADCMVESLGDAVIRETLRAQMANDEEAIGRTFEAFAIAAGFCGLE